MNAPKIIPSIEELGKRIREHTGLCFGEFPLASVWLLDAVRRRQSVTGCFDEAEYARMALTNGLEFQNLVCAIVPSTGSLFFRDDFNFRSLYQLVREGHLPRHPGKPLRVLSAPCSTGEEPYSIAITLLEAGLSPEAFAIDAMDVNKARIIAAVSGRYSAPIVRLVPPDLLLKYFFRADSMQLNGEVQLKAEVTERVRFRTESLTLLGCLPVSATYDVVFCCHLMIYLTKEAQAIARKNIYQAANPGCYFFVSGHSEWPGLKPTAQGTSCMLNRL